MTPEQFRRAALALPDTVEGAHQGHPDFRAHGRVFASLHPDGEQAMVKVPPAVQQRLVSAQPVAMVPANGAWGRAGCVMVRLAAVAGESVREALTEAWQFAAAAGAGAGAKRSKPAKARPPAAKARSKAQGVRKTTRKV